MSSPLRRRLRRIRWLRRIVVQHVYLWRILRQRWFGNIAESADHSHRTQEWDFTTPEVAERNRIIFVQLEKLYGPLHAADVFELGCADGIFTLELAARAKKVVAADISSIGLERARERCVGKTNIELVQMDILKSAPQGKYHVIFAMDVLEFLHGRAQLAHASKLLKHTLDVNGILVVSSCRAQELLRDAYWQNAFPEGGDAHLAFLGRQKGWQLMHVELHPADGQDLPGYNAHILGFFRKVY